MRSFIFAHRAAAAFFACGLTLSAATAGELIVMPYACQMSGGVPVLTPSADQGYKVIGKREAQEFTACSPANPEMCRRWKLHRFDIECGGKRVPWVSVSAAADAHSSRGRSWVENGRMYLEMPPRWSMSADDPCARRARFGWRAAHLARDCAERPRESVEMPAGFAPMLDMDAIFVADNSPTAPAPGAVAQAAPPLPKPSRSDTPHAAEKPAKAPAPSQPAGESKPAITPPQPMPASKPPAPPPPSPGPTETAAAPGTPAVPVIINDPDARAGATKQQPGPQPVSAPETTSALADATDTMAASKTSQIAGDTTPVHSERGEQAITVTLVERLTQSVSPTLLGVGVATLLGLLALLFAARRSETEPDYALGRDIASVSLDGREMARRGRWLAKVAPRGVPAASAPHAHGGAVATWGGDIPQTREQALQVLGMGVSADVGDAAIKKIIDGLRLSWHPDHAKSAGDRELRELRIKQINAAWDIITGKREG